MKNIYLQIPLNIPEMSGRALATVTRTSGSTPQKAGSSALFDSTGLVFGTVGGGVLEGRVQVIARESVYSKKSGHYLFMLDNSVAGGEDALCGGKINILIDSNLENHLTVIKDIQCSVRERKSGILLTYIKGREDEEIIIDRYWITSEIKPSLPAEIAAMTEPVITSMLPNLSPGDFREIEMPSHNSEHISCIFLEPVIPSLRLIIAGAGHIGKALAKIGQMLDFETTVIDDRPEFANPENLKCADHIITEDIGKAISRFEKRDDIYLVIVTRGHENDASALKACIRSNAGYIGMIGSRNKIALMREEFIANGWATEEQWEKIYAPIGLDIKSKTIEEIAVSIAAQLVQVKNSKKYR